MQVEYCAVCNRRLTDQDLLDGKAVMVQGLLYCQTCAHKAPAPSKPSSTSQMRAMNGQRPRAPSSGVRVPAPSPLVSAARAGSGIRRSSQPGGVSGGSAVRRPPQLGGSGAILAARQMPRPVSRIRYAPDQAERQRMRQTAIYTWIAASVASGLLILVGVLYLLMRR